MLAATWRWSFHRALLSRSAFMKPFSQRKNLKRLLLLSERDAICHVQLFPFFLYASEFANQHRIEIRELPLNRFLSGQYPYRDGIDAVCFQTWFDLTRTEMESLCERIQTAWPRAKLAYLDWFAPTDLRYADVLHGHIDAYVKKNTLKDFKAYGEPTLGDTNLSNFYAKRFNIGLPERKFPIPAKFERKFVWGSGFEHSPQIFERLQKPLSLRDRSIDLHARMATDGTEWYRHMRREAQAKAAELSGAFKVTYHGRVSIREYFAELKRSKLCFSPFGYGEVCWRDFEAMSTGALLLKPDMSHLRFAHDLFRPYETYVPVRWDLGDLPEKVAYYVEQTKEREDIAKKAFDLLRSQCAKKMFLSNATQLWQLLQLN
jgi:hypothetical protein